MSTYLDFEVGPKGRRFRRAVDQDKEDIEEFWKRSDTEKLFNVDDIGSLIELSTLSICMIDKEKSVTGFISVSDHPNLPGVDPASWEVWIRNMFQRYYLSHNTLFVHFACCKDSVADFFTEEAFASIFLHNSYWLQIVLVVPPDCPNESLAIFNVFKQRSVYRYCCEATKQDGRELCYYLYVALRKDFCPQLKTRRAVEEDNDEVVAILDNENKVMKDTLGEYYISEIIGRHPEMRRQILVAEIKDRIVGVMGLTSNVDYNALAAIYEISPYRGLKVMSSLEKQHLLRSNDIMETIGEPIMHGEFDPFATLAAVGVPNADDISEVGSIGKRKRESARRRSTYKKSVRLSNVDSYEHKESEVSEASSDNLLSPNPSIKSFSAFDLLDEEAFEYEITNIDAQLIPTQESTMEFVLKYEKHKPSHIPRGLHKTKYQKRHSKAVVDRSQSDSKRPLNQIKEVTEPFAGKPNAFKIELFALDECVDPRRSYDLLVAAFECMKVYEYCLIEVPCSVKHFPLLQHFCLVPTKDTVCCDYSLYIAHRNSVLGKLRVRKAEPADIVQISSLFVNLDVKQTIYTVESAICRKSTNMAFVLMSGLNVVGLAILEQPTQTHEIRTMFTADLHHAHKYHAATHGVGSGFSSLKMVIVYPVFEPHYRFFLRELMRLSGSTALLWMTTYRNKLVASRANSVISAMVPLLPRKSGFQTVVSEEVKNVMGSKPSLTFSAWMLTNRLSSLAQATVDTRIVVVGASQTAMAFLNTLIFGECSTYLTFTNITLVSPNGLPYVRQSSREAELMLLRHRTLSDKFLKCTPYGYYVNIVYGTMCGINRQEKHIILANGQKYNYDKLFLMTGKQYQHPDYMKALLEKEKNIKRGIRPQYVRLDVPRSMEIDSPVTDHNTPENVFIVNTPADAAKAVSYVRSLYWRCQDVKVLVYGASIESYCCLTALLEILNVDEIVFIECFPPEDSSKTRVPVFANLKVDETIRAVISDLKIQCYRGYYFECWRTDPDNIATQVDFVSTRRLVTLDCSAFFYYGKGGINTQAFVAVNKCGVSYDGGVLIDHEFRTNDPAIYSAGTSTRYRRRYCGDYQRQKFYDSYEVGSKLGKQIIDELDPLLPKASAKPQTFKDLRLPKTDSLEKFSPSIFVSSEKSSEEFKVPPYFQLPVFKQPLKFHCILPGGLQYLEIRPPGPKHFHQYIQSMDYAGHTLETFVSGYFKLQLNNDSAVKGITCLTPTRWSLESFKILYGLPSVMLNNVHLRFFSNQIQDLFDFFRAPWAMFLHDEQAAEFLAVAKEIVPKENPHTLAEALAELADRLKLTNASTDLKHKLRVNFDRHAHVRAVTDSLLQWLTDNDLLLPIYMRPWQTVEFAHDITTNPTFRKRKRTVKKMLTLMKPAAKPNELYVL